MSSSQVYLFPLEWGLRSTSGCSTVSNLFFNVLCWNLTKGTTNWGRSKKNILVKLLVSLCSINLFKNPPGLSINLWILVQQSQVTRETPVCSKCKYLNLWVPCLFPQQAGSVKLFNVMALSWSNHNRQEHKSTFNIFFSAKHKNKDVIRVTY